MREIKFRAWDSFNRIWVDGFKLDQDGKIYHLEVVKYEPAYVVEQFTGLLDKNGKEIYEGDIVWARSISHEDYMARVIFDRGCFCVEGVNHGYHINIPLSLEVRGNVHENPELLK